MKIKLGQRVRDKVTGFSGTATGRCEFIASSPTVNVESSQDGKSISSHWVDESRLEVVPKKKKG